MWVKCCKCDRELSVKRRNRAGRAAQRLCGPSRRGLQLYSAFLENTVRRDYRIFADVHLVLRRADNAAGLDIVGRIPDPPTRPVIRCVE